MSKVIRNSVIIGAIIGGGYGGIIGMALMGGASGPPPPPFAGIDGKTIAKIQGLAMLGGMGAGAGGAAGLLIGGVLSFIF